jgi:hypothetical protein
MLTLFISSTYIDQREVRQRVYEIALASGFKVLRMENDEADPLLNRARRDHPDKWSKATVALADVVVVLLGDRYGSRRYGGISPMDSLYSITHIEVLEAEYCCAMVLAYEIGPTLRDKNYERPVGTGEQLHYDGTNIEMLGRRLNAQRLNGDYDFARIARDLRRLRFRAYLRKYRYCLHRRRVRKIHLSSLKRLFEITDQMSK